MSNPAGSHPSGNRHASDWPENAEEAFAQDQVWWRAACTGDDDHARQAYTCLYRRYVTSLLQFAALLTSREEAEDIVQSVFLEIWYARRTTRVDGSVRSYLYAAVRHRSSNTRRNERRALRHGARFAASGEVPAQSDRVGTAADDVERYEADDVHFKTFSELTPRERQVLVLRRYGFSYAEVGFLLGGMSQKTVETLIGRAFRRVRALFAASAMRGAI